jgi:hypothetical protein
MMPYGTDGVFVGVGVIVRVGVFVGVSVYTKSSDVGVGLGP